MDKSPTFDRGLLPPLRSPLALRILRRFVSWDKVPVAPSIARRHTGAKGLQLAPGESARLSVPRRRGGYQPPARKILDSKR